MTSHVLRRVSTSALVLVATAAISLGGSSDAFAKTSTWEKPTPTGHTTRTSTWEKPTPTGHTTRTSTWEKPQPVTAF